MNLLNALNDAFLIGTERIAAVLESQVNSQILLKTIRERESEL